MNLTKFKEIIGLSVKISQKISRVYKDGIDLANFFDDYECIISSLWSEILTDDGMDWLNWFLYEKGYVRDFKETLRAYDKDGNEICRNLEELYELLLDGEYFKCKS